MINIINDVTKMPVVVVPNGKVGLLLARDGAPFRSEQSFADPLHMFAEKGSGKPVEVGRMMSDAAYFLDNGGQKGPQTTVLTPGTYRLNRFLWDVEFVDVTDVPKGFVAVIKSNVYGAVDLGSVLKVEKPKSCNPIQVGDPKKLVAPLVPTGCVGIWNSALPPGQYYLNSRAYQVTPVDTRQQAWLYAGGFTKREVTLQVDLEGKIVQRETSVAVPVPKDAADAAIAVKVEGWTMRQAVRALVQTTPENAPFVVASLGGLTEVENRVVTPAIQSLLTDIAGGFIRVPDPKDPAQMITRPTHALDFIEARKHVENMLEGGIITEAAKAGVLMQEVRLLDTDFPPELLVARKREQLADQLQKAYQQEQIAQAARIKVEAGKATADQQPELVRADIAEQTAIRIARAKTAAGEGERDKMTMIAEGQKAQTSILGPDKVMQLQMFSQILAFFEKNPKVLETAIANAHKFVPTTVVGQTSSGFDLTAAAAALMGMSGAQSPLPAAKAPANPAAAAPGK